MLGFLGCNKEEENKTKLELTVLNIHGFPAAGINVKLYKFIQNYLENVSEIAKDKTNEKGIVSFNNLDSIKYYFSAIDGCSNNYLDIRSATMKAGITTAITIQMQQTANVSITNNTKNKYSIYFNGKDGFFIESMQSRLFSNSMPIGAVNVRVLQVGTNGGPQTDTTYIIEAECNSNESIVIP